MDQQTIITLIGTGSALLGTMAGGVITYFANKSIKSLEWRQSVQKEEIQSRKLLYSEFLRETSHLATQSMHEKISSVAELKELANLVSQIELTSSEAVCTTASVVADVVVASNVKNPTSPEHEKMPSFAQAREKFVIAVREEFESIRNA